MKIQVQIPLEKEVKPQGHSPFIDIIPKYVQTTTLTT